jgi:hypothetical protein
MKTKICPKEGRLIDPLSQNSKDEVNHIRPRFCTTKLDKRSPTLVMSKNAGTREKMGSRKLGQTLGTRASWTL